ncbi:hypothetical protein [Streptomyces flavochromogenes]|uniref:hypothetical protein n=1 Tax=Streptomyces flavochromogenes TaxID=68199 RepID=UPI0004C0E2C0|nr:hypothetical protein [Streptomyces flavochromogenes]
MSTLLALIKELRGTSPDARIGALVVNESEPRLFAPDALPQHLRMRRRSVTELLLPYLPAGGMGLDEDGVFPLHLPSVLTPESAHPGIRGQWEAFRTAVARQTELNGRNALATACTSSLPHLDAAAALRAQRIRQAADTGGPQSEPTRPSPC